MQQVINKVKPEIKGIEQGETVVLVIPNELYSQKIGGIARTVAKKSKAVCYVSLNKLINALEPKLKKSGADVSKFLFVDGITKSANPNIEEADNVMYVGSASALTEISLTLGKIFNSGHFDGFIFDSLSTLLVYNNPKTVGKFVHNIINKIKAKNMTAVFTALEGDTNSSLLKECSMYVDNVVHLK